MREMAFEHGPVPRGRVVLEARNAGQFNHRLSVVPLPEDLPPLDEQLRGSERRFVDQLASTSERLPGQRGVVAVDLAPGRYAFMCFVVDPDGVSHALKGMFSEFRVR